MGIHTLLSVPVSGSQWERHPTGSRSIRARRLARVGGAGLLLATLALTGCGMSGSSGTQPADQAAAGGCEPVKGDKLVILVDDKKLQTADNIVPALNAKRTTQPMLDALNAASAVLDQASLIALNKAVGVDRVPANKAAQAFAGRTSLGNKVRHNSGTGPVIIGAANFPESKTIAELYRIALIYAGFTPTVRTIGNRELYEPALERGEIHIVPEYVGTLTEFLNKKLNGAAAGPLATGDVDHTIDALAELGPKSKLRFGKPAAAADQNAFAVTQALADFYHLRTLSQFAQACSGQATVLGGPPECPQRPFCQPGLQGSYAIKFGKFSSLDAGGPRLKTALKQGAVTIGLVLTSDPEFAS